MFATRSARKVHNISPDVIRYGVRHRVVCIGSSPSMDCCLHLWSFWPRPLSGQPPLPNHKQRRPDLRSPLLIAA